MTEGTSNIEGVVGCGMFFGMGGLEGAVQVNDMPEDARGRIPGQCATRSLTIKPGALNTAM